MRNFFLIFSVFICLLSTRSFAQSFYGTPDGTRFIYSGNGTSIVNRIEFRNGETIWPQNTALPNYSVVTNAAVEIYGLDEDNNEITLTAESPYFNSFWIGKSFIDGVDLDDNDPAIKKVVVIMNVTYHDPVNGYQEVGFEYEYEPLSANGSGNVGIDTTSW